MVLARTEARAVPYDSPEVTALVARLQTEYVARYGGPDATGLGLGRRLLAELELLARAEGCDQMVLETGQAQPEAIALYRSAGYVDIPAFGYYRASDQSVHLGKPLLPAP